MKSRITLHKGQLAYTKLAACGNDFIAIDNREQLLKGSEVKLIQALCHRRFGVGADGVLFVERSTQVSGDHANSRHTLATATQLSVAQTAKQSHLISTPPDFHMRIFNADGSEAAMCGNGARACARFAEELGFQSPILRFSTLAGIQEVERDGHGSRIELSPVSERLARMSSIKKHSTLLEPTDGLRCLGDLVVGVPHLVIAVNKGLAELDLSTIAPALRYHSVFEPHGVNVMFVEREKNALYLRAWEKGVEGETWGCGTGAVAACLLLDGESNSGKLTRVRMKGGVMLVEAREEAPAFSGEVTVCHAGLFPVEGLL
jgi:diaminopimelate epimerase